MSTVAEKKKFSSPSELLLSFGSTNCRDQRNEHCFAACALHKGPEMPAFLQSSRVGRAYSHMTGILHLPKVSPSGFV